MILEAKCRKCRAMQEKLFLKGERCYSQKCNLLRRPSKPGPAKKGRRGGQSEYGRQLSEKQKLKLSYGINERQLRKYFEESLKSKGMTGDVLLKKLEMRLDNVVFRLGLAGSRRLARQLVSHGHFLVNGKRTRVASYVIKKDDLIKVKSQSIEKTVFKNIKNNLKKYQTPSFLLLDPEKMEGRIKGDPNISELNAPFSMSLVVEFYSK